MKKGNVKSFNPIAGSSSSFGNQQWKRRPEKTAPPSKHQKTSQFPYAQERENLFNSSAMVEVVIVAMGTATESRAKCRVAQRKISNLVQVTSISSTAMPTPKNKLLLSSLKNIPTISMVLSRCSLDNAKPTIRKHDRREYSNWSWSQSSLREKSNCKSKKPKMLQAWRKVIPDLPMEIDATNGTIRMDRNGVEPTMSSSPISEGTLEPQRGVKSVYH
ncbi:OLC1v1031200C1 [Oldenlandia corymbosa var. corymbosa]|uniref:OLC1v1031200C1 n=1 Tax=Oldenlandia corymbosa var. corymbosa TaxID=529605 RepID=A0AAV1CJR1_OLDCO|nr:OLC1v1031200C1 [Oldenlandia corymbosa var. corymbosa]